MATKPEYDRGGFIHSVKLPQIYKKAQKILVAVLSKETSLKNSLYNVHHARKAALYGLLHETLKNLDLIDELIEKSGLEQEERLDSNLLRILICEMMFRKKSLPTGSKPVCTVLKYEEALQKEFELLKDSQPLEKTDSVFIPRYVRVNTLKNTIDDVVEELKNKNFNEIIVENDISYKKYKKILKSLGPGNFVRDPHVTDLLVFHSNQRFHDWDLYKNAKIILQDKCSCFPPLLLNPSPGSIVLDACAAPGIKSHYLAVLMENEGNLLAVDKDKRRASHLRHFLKQNGVQCAKVQCKDFTQIDYTNSPYNEVEYILVDPSCTGSGIPSRKLEETTYNEPRLRSISAFQFKILCHALSFPSVKRVVYSTCSLYPDENEMVVIGAAKKFEEEFQLEHVMPWWERRGLEQFPDLKATVRMIPSKDMMTGFFIAVFQRKSEENKYVKTRKSKMQNTIEDFKEEEEEEEHGEEENQLSNLKRKVQDEEQQSGKKKLKKNKKKGFKTER